jgi:A/G-specific adenine glycosylase
MITDIEDLGHHSRDAHVYNHNNDDNGNDELTSVRRSLMAWYYRNRRSLPWRRPDATATPNTHDALAHDNNGSSSLSSLPSTPTFSSQVTDQQQHAYGVWVSEMMCQQTRVATVIDYYNRWMTRLPTLASLAAATIEDVHTLWAGLGESQPKKS